METASLTLFGLKEIRVVGIKNVVRLKKISANDGVDNPVLSLNQFSKRPKFSVPKNAFVMKNDSEGPPPLDSSWGP